MFKITSKIIFISLATFLLGCSFFITPVQAEDYQLSNIASTTNYNTAASGSLESGAQRALKITLSLMGLIFIGFVIYGGMRWMTAQGNEDLVTTAKDTIEAAVIGLVVVALSYAITTLIFSKISGLNSTTSTGSNTDPSLQGVGADCTQDSDCDGVCSLAGKCDKICEDDASCIGNPNGPICNSNYKCSPFVEGKNAAGGACADNTNCNDGLFCIQNVCKTGGIAGDDCNPPACSNGLICSEDHKCSSASSLAINEGDSCAAVPCAGGLKCSDGKICLQVVGKGGNCLQSTAGFPVICQDGLVCGVGAKCADPNVDPEAKCLADGGLWQNSHCTSATKIDQCINTKVECESNCSQTKVTCEAQCENVSSQCKINNCDNPYTVCEQKCTPAVCMSDKGCSAKTGNDKIACEEECKTKYPIYCSSNCSNIKQSCYDNCNTQTTCKNSCVSNFNFCSNQAQCEKNYQTCLST